jgi:mannose-1-phosphate guanylyltransferase / mannose-6-phosphate isomerase
MRIIPVILSGGAGTRLWPLSRPEKPKQFLDFGFGSSLFAMTVQRCSGELFDPRPIVVAAHEHKSLIHDALAAEQRQAEILLEPVRRDSCAAVVAGALAALARDPDSLVLVVAADHLIPDQEAFRKCVEDAAEAARSGWIVTFGITPTEPATGYGYISASDHAVGGTAHRVALFREKPNRETAVEYLRQGFFWNSGNFLFRAIDFLTEAEKLAPTVVAAVRQAMGLGRKTAHTIALEEASFATAPRISVDFAIMEKTQKAAIIPANYMWSDIGSWDAVAKVIEEMRSTPAQGNVSLGNSLVHTSTNTFVMSDAQRTTVVGCDDLIVVVTRDAVLVTKKGQSGEMKPMLEILQAKGLGLEPSQ